MTNTQQQEMEDLRWQLHDSLPDADDQTLEDALDLARHAALPAALNLELLHLLRINFLAAAHHTVEYDLLLSPLCLSLGNGLYEIDTAVRNTLLHDLAELHGPARLEEVARLLGQYTHRPGAPWGEDTALERAQRLTALSFVEPAAAQDWLARAEQALGDGRTSDRNWFVALQRELDRVSRDLDAPHLRDDLPRPVVQALLHTLRGYYPECHNSLWVYDQINQTLVLHPEAHQFFVDTDREENVTLEFSLNSSHIAANTIRRVLEGDSSATDIISDAALDTEYLPFYANTRSELSLPLQSIDRKLIGLVVLEHPRPSVLTEEDGHRVARILRAVQIQEVPIHQLDALLYNLRMYLADMDRPGFQADLEQRLKQFKATVIRVTETLADQLDKQFLLDSAGHNAESSQLPLIETSGLRALSGEIGELRFALHRFRPALDGLSQQQLGGIERAVGAMADAVLDSLQTNKEILVLDDWLRPAVERIVATHTPSFGCTLDLQTPGVQVEAVPVALGNALSNVVRNSLKAMGDRGHLTIRTRPAGQGMVEVLISDTGPAIPQVIRDRLFTQMFPGQSETQSDWGLALLVARALVEQFGGTLRLVESGESGSTFAMALPVYRVTPQTVKDRPAETKKIRVLIVESNPSVRDEYVELLKYWKFEPVVTEGLADALLENAVAKAKQRRCQLALVDLHLINYQDPHDRSGLALASELRMVPTAVILMSIHGDMSTAVTALRDHQVANFVNKYDGPTVLQNVLLKEQENLGLGEQRPRIDWGQINPQQLHHDLFEADSNVPHDEIEELLCRLFQGHQRLVLSPINQEYISSGPLLPAPRRRARVLLVRVDDQPALRVLKLATPQRTNEELQRFNDYVRYGLPGQHRPELERHRLLWDVGAIVYNFLGRRNSHALPTFTQYYRSAKRVQEINAPLEHFFGDNSWGSRYRETRKQTDQLFEAYDRIWGHTLSRMLPSWAIEERSRSFPSLDSPALLPNPKRWLADHKDETVYIYQLREAITHGDVHGDNLFVDQGHAWAIDFERSGYGPILRDFIELIQDILTRIAKFEPRDFPVLYQLAVALCHPVNPKTPMRSTSLIQGHSEARKAFDVIQKLQTLAHQQIAFPDRREYLWGLLLNNLFSTTLVSPGDPRHDRALLLAAVICQRLENWHKEAWLPKDAPKVVWSSRQQRYISSQPVMPKSGRQIKLVSPTNTPDTIAQIRARLEHLNSDELDEFGQTYFMDLWANMSNATTLSRRRILLIDYCQRRKSLGDLQRYLDEFQS